MGSSVNIQVDAAYLQIRLTAYMKLPFTSFLPCRRDVVQKLCSLTFISLMPAQTNVLMRISCMESTDFFPIV